MNSLKNSIKVAAFAAVCASTLGLMSLQSGCAATPTKESTGEYVDDATVTTKVKAALLKDDNVKSSDISVETFKGVVQLSGFVDNSTQKSRAGEVAASITGVRDVKNNITVK
ncbi:MAG: BON domain-containing protein [Opitutaceae bacterium]